MAYTIRVGNTGIDVQKMQYYINQILKAPNLTPMVEDGVYGQLTEFAVAVYQYVKMLPVDGIIGADTWNHVISDFKNLSNVSPETRRPTSTLQVGSVGLAVQKFQQYLNAILTPSPGLVVDGNFGSRTKSAVERFQALNNLSIDGIIGTNTWNRIINMI